MKASIFTMSLGALILAASSAAVAADVTPQIVSEGATSKPGGNNVNAKCPQTYTFTFALTAPAAGSFHYHFVRSDGATGPVSEKTVKAGQKFNLTDTWELGGPGFSISGAWVGLVINGGAETHMSSFSLQCKK